MTGRSYFGFRIKNGEKKKYIQDVLKSERRMGNRCKSEFCAKGIYRFCSSIPEETRRELFNYFWNDLDWKGKKNYVRSLIDIVPPKRRRKNDTISRKIDTKLYHLIYKKERLSVCRIMFLNTLGIKEAMLRSWLSKEKKKKPKIPIKSLNVNRYIDNLPKYKSKCQFCTNIEYVNVGNVKNLYQLYNFYANDVKNRGQLPASRKTFSNVASKKNIRIFKPKNDGDVCDLFGDHNLLPCMEYNKNVPICLPCEVNYYYE